MIYTVYTARVTLRLVASRRADFSPPPRTLIRFERERERERDRERKELLETDAPLTRSRMRDDDDDDDEFDE